MSYVPPMHGDPSMAAQYGMPGGPGGPQYLAATAPVVQYGAPPQYGAPHPHAAMGTVSGLPGGSPTSPPHAGSIAFSPHFNQPPLNAPGVIHGQPQPGNTTAGLPDPETIAKQKDGYIRLLDEQLKQGTATLDQQRKQQTEYLYQQAEHQKKQVSTQVDQQVKQQEMALLRRHNEHLLQVQTQSSQQKSALEQQAMQLCMEYTQKKSQEDMMMKQHQLQREHGEAQMKFAQEMQRLQAPGQAHQQPRPH